ncbi:uncharacterized protein LOC133882057 [Alnus glutinosa]|uniref:uncharacterized protein LOC133882057 n=1 Tax=Alnus glutinosa TaxID=3517 RepID=UPI002D764D3A|nr:uncharacterized protein LOC133882057 [Alnus glutinosa]
MARFFFKSRSFLPKILHDDSDDDLEIIARALEEEGLTSHRGGTKRRRHIVRNRLQGHERLVLDYFAESPIYPPRLFRRRFHMRRPLFLRIVSEIEDYEPYFVQERNAAGILGFSSLQKITAALRMLAYRVTGDYVDEYLRLSESTAMDSLKLFAQAVVSLYSDVYLRSPTNHDIARLLAEGRSRGFPRMLGSIDCMHWKWKNCPTSWRGMYSGHKREATIILEAVASYDLWIWHAFFGLPGSNNDINVLDKSFIFTKLAQGRGPRVNYSINGHDYTMGYYLANGIYPQWSTFVKTISAPLGAKKKHFAAAQESARKDVERAFEVLQARFAIVRQPARFFKIPELKQIMKACIILHNMIIEDEKDEQDTLDFDYEQLNANPLEPVSHNDTDMLSKFISNRQRIRDRGNHCQLQSGLVEHLWQLHGQS